MCGRFVSAAPPDEVASYFSVDPAAAGSMLPPEIVIEPSWNVAPTDDVTVVRSSGSTRVMERYRWGLVPYWAKDIKVGSRMINARADTLAKSGAFQHAFRRRRCLVPADGFYEWKAGPARSASTLVHPPARWRALRVRRPVGVVRVGDAGGRRAAAHLPIITTTPNEVVAELHDRMPVISRRPSGPLARPDRRRRRRADGLLRPGADRHDRDLAVSSDVSNVRKDGPHLIEPIALRPPVGVRSPEERLGPGHLPVTTSAAAPAAGSTTSACGSGPGRCRWADASCPTPPRRAVAC